MIMKLFIIISLVFMAQDAAAQDSPQRLAPVWPSPPHVDTLLAYEGHTETSDNSSPHVDRFLASTGLDPGYPWCAAFVSYGLEQSGASYPDVRSALARDFVTDRSVQARKVLNRGIEIERGYIVVWRRGNTIQGHAGAVLYWEGGSGSVVEGNTTPQQGSGVDYNGGGVYEKQRTIEPANYFRITDFTPFNYEAHAYNHLSRVGLNRNIRFRYRILGRQRY